MRVIALFSVLCLCSAFVLGGRDVLGRLALIWNAPHIAQKLIDTPNWKGIAAFRANEFSTAAAQFSGAKTYFNLGNAEANAGRYAAALEAYDVAILQGHTNARHNFDIIAAAYARALKSDAVIALPKREHGPKLDSFIGQGDARAAGTGDEATNSNTMLGLAELDSRGRLGVRRIFDDAFIIADQRWLEQLPDVPGSFLKARISAESKRREKVRAGRP